MRSDISSIPSFPIIGITTRIYLCLPAVAEEFSGRFLRYFPLDTIGAALNEETYVADKQVPLFNTSSITDAHTSADLFVALFVQED